MAKRSLLLVDGDARSLRVLEVSLKKAGFTVTTAATGEDAFAIVEASPPDLIISNTALEGIDGFEFCQRLKDHDDDSLASIPFIFLTDQHSIEHKIRGLELGVDEYLTKPIYIKEILTRVKILLQKRDRFSLEARKGESTRFTGKLADMGVVDLIQTIEVSSKSGVSHFTSPNGQRASLYFRSGRVIDAELGTLQGADAIYRLLTWSDGDFEVLFRPVRRRDVIALSSQALLMEGMRRLDEWGRLLEQLPPLSSRFEVVYPELAERLSELPDELNELLKLFDGRRSLMDIIDQTPQGDLESLELIAKLFFEGLIVETDLEAPPSESWPPPVEDEPIELPPARVRDELDEEPEHEPGDEMLDIELSEAVLESDAEDEEPARLKRAPSLVDVAIEAVAPIHPELDSLPALSKPAAADPEPASDPEPTSHPASDPEPASDEVDASSDVESESVGASQRPASDTLPTAIVDGDWDDESVEGSAAETLATTEEQEIARLETGRRALQMIPTLVEKVRHFGERTERTPLPDVSAPHASSARARTVRDSAVTEPIPPADDTASSPDQELDSDARASAEALAIARDVDAAMLEMQSDFVRRSPEPPPEPVAGTRPQLEIQDEDESEYDDDDYEDEEEGVTPVHRPPLKEQPRLEVVDDEDDLNIDDSAFEDEGSSTPLDPLPPAYQHSGPIDSPHIVSSAGQEVATAAGAISGSASSEERGNDGRDSVEVDEELREPEEPTIEEPLNGRNRRSSPPSARPPRARRSPFPVIVGVVLTATLIGVIFLLRYRGSDDTADVSAGSSDVSEVGLAVQDERPVSSLDGAVALDASVASVTPDAAVDDIIEIIDAGPTRRVDAALDPAAERRLRARELLREAQRTMRRGRLDEALTQVQESIELRPTGRALATKASLMLRLKNREAAIRAADESLALHPRGASAWLTKGRAHFQLAQYGEARTAFERYLELRPTGTTSDEVRIILETL